MLYTINHDAQSVWRVEAHPLTMRHTIAIEEYRVEIQDREDAGDLSAFAAVSMMSFPLLAHGATWFSAPLPDGDVSEDALRNLDYKPFILTESDFLSLTEAFVEQVMEAVVVKNPQRNMRVELLKKMLDDLTKASKPNSPDFKPDTRADAAISGVSSSSSSRKKKRRKKAATPTPKATSSTP